ncbi:phosphopyruvate hydratase [Candidatus Shapirobacteria bacterium]|nr:phosphopyruvate hydratase [Candidatus Shapirobacteria bacterium]
MSKIKSVKAREILASGGAPSVEVTVTLESGSEGEASVSYGASSGSREAAVILDKNPKRYNGRGMMMVTDFVNKLIGPSMVGKEAGEQRLRDEEMIKMDGTEGKTKLGGNAILGVSMAIARAQAAEEKLPLYKYLQKCFGLEDNTRLPKPMIVMIEGGKHADKTTDLQEFCVAAMGDKSAAENVRMLMEIYEALKKILKSEGLSTNVGNEGAFAPNGLTSNEKPMEYLVEAIRLAGYVPGVDVGISLDAAASEFYDLGSKTYDLRIEHKKLSSNELIEYYMNWIEKYPFVSWEDMLSEFDWENWPVLLKRMGGRFPLIADDLTVTNTKIWQEAIDKKAANAILVKLNQAGSVSETIDCCLLAIKNKMWTVPSHRGGGETNDTFMVDLAVAVGSEYIKAGPTRGERVCKYNRLMRIEEGMSIE